MNDAGPYRSGGLERCPRCAAPLVAQDVGARACPAGCGEWFTATTVAERWADAVDLDGDPRLRWHAAKLEVGCLICGEPMRRVVHRAWSSYRCRDHGVWFPDDGRARFEAELATEITARLAIDRRRRARVVELRARLEASPRALYELVVELETLEQTNQALRAELEARRIDISVLLP